MVCAAGAGGSSVSVFRSTLSISLICPSFSLGCSAAAPGSAGGCCAAAEAGDTEVQHGQRSTGRRKCETNDDFHVALHFSTRSSSVDASLCEIDVEQMYHVDLCVCRQSSNTS